MRSGQVRNFLLTRLAIYTTLEKARTIYFMTHDQRHVRCLRNLNSTKVSQTTYVGPVGDISEVSQERLSGPKLDYDVIFLN